MRKPTRQLSFRIEDATYSKLEACASFEELSIADFARKVFKISFREYLAAGSLHVLREKCVVGFIEEELSQEEHVVTMKKKKQA